MKNGIEAEVGNRQLAMKPSTSQSWFHRVNKVAKSYGLRNCFTIMGEPPWAKRNWKDVVKNSIHEFQTSKCVEELTSSLPSLAALNLGTVLLGTPHPVWETCGYSAQAVKEAISKVRFLTDTFLTGEN